MKLANRLQKATLMATLPVAASVIGATIPLSAAYAQAPAALMTVLTPRPNETLGTNRFNLDVKFKSITSSPVVTAELWVDGVRWVRRDLESPRRASVLSFLVDGSTLSAGSHTIVVKVLNAEGDVSSAKVSVIAGSDAGETEIAANGPAVQFVTPGNGRKVTGSVELLVDAQSKTGQNPYVAFYVDNKFKTLKNYPPYSFVWDTTNETNGVHEVVATGSLDSSNAATTRRIRVFVDNPGGNTVRQKEIPDLSAPKSLSAPKHTPILTPARAAIASIPMPAGEAHSTDTVAESVVPLSALGLAGSDSTSTMTTVALPRLSVPKSPVFAVKVAHVAVKASPIASIAASVIVPEAKPTIVSAVKPSNIRLAKVAVVSETKPVTDAEPTLSGTVESSVESAGAIDALSNVTITAPRTSVAAPHFARPATPIVRVAPAPSVAAPVALFAVPQKNRFTHHLSLHFSPTASLHFALPATHLAHRAVSAPVSLPAPRVVAAPVPTIVRHTAPVLPIKSLLPAKITARSMQVAFDGTRIAFDVAPRVEAGMPIAPFRQIFEHTGGRVSWQSNTKTMRAVNSDREIVIGVGNAVALVNGEAVSMDRVARLDRGRTLVPLTFVGKALDVDVKYDPATGRLSITSKH